LGTSPNKSTPPSVTPVIPLTTWKSARWRHINCTVCGCECILLCICVRKSN